MPPATPGVPFLPTEELVRTKLPNFGYQLFFAREDSAAKIESALEQFLTTNFSPSVRALAYESGKPMPQFPVKEGEMEQRIEGILEAKRRGETRPIPQDPVRAPDGLRSPTCTERQNTTGVPLLPRHFPQTRSLPPTQLVPDSPHQPPRRARIADRPSPGAHPRAHDPRRTRPGAPPGNGRLAGG